MMDFRSLLSVARRRWFLVVAAVLAGAAIGAIALLATPTRFESRSDLLLTTPGWNDVLPPPGPDAATATGSLGDAFTVQRAQSYVRLSQSDAVLSRVKAAVGYDGSLAELGKVATASLVPDTALIEVTGSAPTAEESQRLAQSMATELAREIEQVESGSSIGIAGSPIIPVHLTPVGSGSSTVEVTAYEYIYYGAATGLLGGLTTAALLSASRRRRIATIDDAATSTGLPILGQVTMSRSTAGALTVADASRIRFLGLGCGGRAEVFAPVGRDASTALPEQAVEFVTAAAVADTDIAVERIEDRIQVSVGSVVDVETMREERRQLSTDTTLLAVTEPIPMSPAAIEMASGLDAPVVIAVTLGVNRHEDVVAAIRECDDAGIAIAGCILLDYNAPPGSTSKG